MVDFPGHTSIDAGQPNVLAPLPGRSAGLKGFEVQPPIKPTFDIRALDNSTAFGSFLTAGPGVSTPATPQTARDGFTTIDASIGGTWFERIHVVPRTRPLPKFTSLSFGNIISTAELTFEIFSAFRKLTVSLNTFTNNAGLGISVPDLPSLPFQHGPLTQIRDPSSTRLGGLPLIVQATPDGPATFDGPLDFSYSIFGLAQLFVSGDRIAVIIPEPSGSGTGTVQGGFDEVLEWATDIQPVSEGKEKRDSYRKNPRQILNFNFSAANLDRQILQALFFEWHSRVFAVPIRFEQVRVTTAIVGGTTSTVTTDDLTFVDMRVGALAIVFKNRTTFDVLEVASKTASSITLTSSIQNSYDVGDLVMPVRLAHAQPSIRGTRFPVTLEEFRVQFRVIDNDTGIPAADTSAFSSHLGKVLFDDCNLLRGNMNETLERRLFVIDNLSGLVTQSSAWDRDKRTHTKGFLTQTRQELFELRQLLLALRGRQISFFIPSFAEDLTLSQDLSSGLFTMDIENMGYARFIQNRQPKATFRITFTDGTSLVRDILDSVELTVDEERLTVDLAWPANRTVDEVVRIEFYEMVRFDSDSLTIRHQTRIGSARMLAPVRTVFDNV